MRRFPCLTTTADAATAAAVLLLFKLMLMFVCLCVCVYFLTFSADFLSLSLLATEEIGIEKVGNNNGEAVQVKPYISQ